MNYAMKNPALLNSYNGGGTVYFAGDSMSQRGWTTVGTTFNSFSAEGIFNQANMLLGQPFRVTGSVAVGGTTAAHFLNVQVPQILALPVRPEIVFVITGHNSIFVTPAETAANTIQQITEGIKELAQAGILVIYTTVFARAFLSNALQQVQKAVNDGIRQFWLSTQIGIFWDGFLASVDPDTAANAVAARSGWLSDGIHPNNLGAYYLGKSLANALSSLVLKPNLLPAGAEDWAASTDWGNLLTNPMMTGTGGTVGNAQPGTAPDGWTIQRLAGSPTWTSSIIDITDPVTGLKIGQGMRAAITFAAANDEVQVINTTSIHTRMSARATYEAECRIAVASPVNVNQVRMRVRADSGSGEQAWALNADYSAVNYPEAFSGVLRTRQITPLAAPTQGFLQCLIRASDAGSVTFDVSAPRVRRVA